MSQLPEQEAPGVKAPEQGSTAPKGARPIRMWPAVAIVVAYYVTLIVSLSMPTLMGNMIGVVLAPMAIGLLLPIWWLTASRAAIRERLIGAVLYAGVLVWVVKSQPANGERLLQIASPVLVTSIVLTLLVTGRLPWQVRRWTVVVVMLLCAIFFPLLRVVSVGGNLEPILAWRWSPSSEDLIAQARSKSSAGPGEKAVLPPQIGPLDWPAFRGPARDGRLFGTRFSTDWTARPPKELWRRPVGLGFSAFTVVGNYIFTQEQRHADEFVVCYRADSGAEVWLNHVTARFDDATGSGPRATPTYEDGKLYTLGATGVLQCLDAASGDVLWKRSLTEDAHAERPQWGFASSPLITGNLAVVFAGGKGGKGVIAYDRTSGNIVWSAGDGTHGYSSAQLAAIDGVSQMLMVSNFGVQSFVPETGALLWEHRWEVKMNPRVVQPLVTEASVLIGTAEGKGTRQLQLARADDHWNVQEKWTTRSFRPYFNDYVYDKGCCYGFDGNMLCCMDAATGENRWKGPKLGGQVLLLADMEVLLVLSESGDVVLVKAAPDAFHEIARFKALTGKTWNHPVVARGKLFVRNDSEAACYELPL